VRLSNDTPWMTIAMALIVVIAATAGGVVTIVNPDALSFEDYLDKLSKIAFAVAGLGAGRAIRKGLQARAGVIPEAGAGGGGAAAAYPGAGPGVADDAAMAQFASHPDQPTNALDAGLPFPGAWSEVEALVEDFEVELDYDLDEPLDPDLDDLPSDPTDAVVDDELADLEDDDLRADDELGAYDAPVTQPGEVEPEVSKPAEFRDPGGT
jgi:hypothetical protein